MSAGDLGSWVKALQSDHCRGEIACSSVRAATTLLRRRGFGSVVRVRSGVWLCARRKRASTYSAVAEWHEATGTLLVWGDLPIAPDRKLASSEVGPYVEVRLPRAIWEWVTDELGAEVRQGERSPGPAIRRQFLAKKR